MPVQLLPPDFDDRAAQAVQAFWRSRGTATGNSQGGTRNAVLSGKNMDGFVDLVRAVAVHCGLPAEEVHTRRSSVILPGYFRATKNWDVLVVPDRRLLAVFEFKSQVGAFGNNLNNRSEEVIGSAKDLWTAHEHGAYTEAGTEWECADATSRSPRIDRDPRPPFLGWLMLLEDCPRSTMQPVRVEEPHFLVSRDFRGATYARRYQLLCERLVARQLYGAAALVLSPADGGAAQGTHRTLSDATSLRTLFAEFAGRTLAAVGSP